MGASGAPAEEAIKGHDMIISIWSASAGTKTFQDSPNVCDLQQEQFPKLMFNSSQRQKAK